MSGWERKEVWKRAGRGFLVEVSRHEVDVDVGEGPHRWCIYAYIYPKHPAFGQFKVGGGMWEQPDFGMHAGNSFFRTHYNGKGEIASFQVGCDYNHDGDDYFTHLATREDAGSVFYDASATFDALAAMEESE